MRRRTNTITVILLAVMMALFLCSCGESESGSSQENVPAQSSGQEESVTHDESDGLLFLEVNGQTLEAELEDNEAAQALKAMIGEDGLKLDLKEYGGFEKVGPLPEDLPASDEQIDTTPGDIVLYQGNQLSLFYGENSWSYTRLGHVKDMDGTQLQEVLGDGDISVILRVDE